MCMQLILHAAAGGYVCQCIKTTTPYYIAAFDLQGVMYASASSKDAPSVLMYSPFDSWAANSDWQMNLPEGEEATAVAAGQTFCAVATSQRMLRIFSQAGVLYSPCIALQVAVAQLQTGNNAQNAAGLSASHH